MGFSRIELEPISPRFGKITLEPLPASNKGQNKKVHGAAARLGGAALALSASLIGSHATPVRIASGEGISQDTAHVLIGPTRDLSVPTTFGADQQPPQSEEGTQVLGEQAEASSDVTGDETLLALASGDTTSTSQETAQLESKFVTLPEFPGMQFKETATGKGKSSEWSFYSEINSGINMDTVDSIGFTNLTEKYLATQNHKNAFRALWLPPGTDLVDEKGNRDLLHVGMTSTTGDIYYITTFISIKPGDNDIKVLLSLKNPNDINKLKNNPAVMYDFNESVARLLLDSGMNALATVTHALKVPDDIWQFSNGDPLALKAGISISFS